jgi:hypothetical protein
VTLGVPDSKGTTTWHGLPPGEYYVATMTRGAFDESGTLDDRDFLERLVAGAAKVTLTEGQSRSVSVTVIER